MIKEKHWNYPIKQGMQGFCFEQWEQNNLLEYKDNSAYSVIL